MMRIIASMNTGMYQVCSVCGQHILIVTDRLERTLAVQRLLARKAPARYGTCCCCLQSVEADTRGNVEYQARWEEWVLLQWKRWGLNQKEPCLEARCPVCEQEVLVAHSSRTRRAVIKVLLSQPVSKRYRICCCCAQPVSASDARDQQYVGRWHSHHW